MEQQVKLDLSSGRVLVLAAKALSSETRIELLKLLDRENLNVNEIAERLNIPASSAAMNVKVLEEAGLIRTELKPGIRGSMKVCIKQVRSLDIMLSLPEPKKQNLEIISMPIGNYVDYRVEPTCGIISDMANIDMEDEPRCFYNPKRSTAKLLWFGNGYVEYRFPNANLQENTPERFELSTELCSEDTLYNLDFPSDITVWINEIEAGTWECPSDFGGRRGKLNPDWWPDQKTQYGILKTWSADSMGTYLDGVKVTDTRLEQYGLAKEAYISVRIGIKPNAAHVGGVNIFGDCFGDHPQDIVLKLYYQ